MKILRVILFTCIAALGISPQSQTQRKDPGKLFPIRQNQQWGFIDKSGKVVISPQFQAVGGTMEGKGFSEGLAWVCFGRCTRPPETGDTNGYIDATGQIVINPRFEEADSFSEGLARVRIGGKSGFIDRTGKIVINPQYVYADLFSEGLAVAETSGKAFYIDKTGRIAIDPKPPSYMHLIPAQTARKFSEGLAAVGFRSDVGKQDIKWGYFNRTGKLVIPPQFYDENSPKLNFSEGLVIITVSGKSGYMDRTGKIVINPQFRLANSFSEGLACVGVGEYPNIKFGFIDKTGRFVINPQFAAAGDIPHLGNSGGFSDGLAAVGVGSTNPNPFKNSNDLKYGYIDKTGKLVIDPQFDFAGEFNGGLADVVMGRGNDRKRGYIDKGGKYVWKPTN
jgi:hypothetical protein